jgi:hypothetical protein
MVARVLAGESRPSVVFGDQEPRPSGHCFSRHSFNSYTTNDTDSPSSYLLLGSTPHDQRSHPYFQDVG